MKKDVIYIDTEDDITAIIGKVKAASARIVALVPPKRTGVLQSAVNLKLLQKSALEDDKRVVLITNDSLLTSLAAGVKLPVAKNLQSKPEVPDIPALQVDDTDVINGEELPVGDFAKAAGVAEAVAADSAADEISKHVDLTDKLPSSATLPARGTKASSLGKFGSKISIPNFDRFRKWFFIGGGGLIVLIVFLVWALVIAPTAMVTITAQTSSVDIDRTLSLVPSLDASKTDQLQLKPVVKQLKKTASVDFTATGSKDIGDKAGGTMTVRNCDYAGGFTLPVGTAFTGDDGHVFSSTAEVSVPAFTGSASSCSLSGSSAGKATVAVQANDIGPDYNVDSQAYSFPLSGKVDAVGTAMTGGSKQTVTVVSQDDVDKATQQLGTQDQNAAKQQLQAQFGSDQLVIAESFSSQAGTPTPNPAVGQQAKQGKLSVDTTYTLVSVARTDVDKLLSTALKDALNGKPYQSIFNNGSNTIQFQSFQQLGDGSYTARMTTTGYIGTTIDTKQLTQQIEGKRYGEIDQMVSQIPGVNKVTINLSPFWVTSAPNDPHKITIRFTLVNGGR